MTLLLLLSLGCRTKDEGVLDTGEVVVDSDGDGVPDADDCAPDDADISPDAEEICDGLDNDCDGLADNGATDATDWWVDADGDGVGDGSATESCDAPSEQHVGVDGDCDDADAETYPGAPERCNGLDNDCDGEVDNGLIESWYADADADDYGDPAAAIDSCDPGEGYVADDTDCDDADPTSFPGGTEVCDGADNNCEGTIDEGVTTTFYTDADADGFGDASLALEACELPEGASENSEDCNDSETAINPAAEEICDEIDNNCDGAIDEDTAADAATWYSDLDSDGYGDVSTGVASCTQPSGLISDATDCDDTEAAINPGADEICDLVDNNCDGSIDESTAIDASTWYADSDSDGYGDASSSSQACTQPTGSVSDNTDCDDTAAAVNTAATEICDTIDNNCDGSVDEDTASDALTWYADADSDGYGDASSSSQACTQPSGSVSDATDCDDGDSSSNPGATEVCDGNDNDCDGTDDNGLLGTGASCPADDCVEILADNSANVDGSYSLDDGSGNIYDAYCEMDNDGGGWTLVGSTVNDYLVSGTHSRAWNSYAVWTDTTTFGSISNRQTTDYKGEAYNFVTGDDVMIVTDEYAFAFYNIAGTVDFASMVAANYDSTTCNSSTFMASGADWQDGSLSTNQALATSFIVRPLDSNAACFPTTNENAILGMQMASCCWTPGMGNTPSGQATWSAYDLSLLTLTAMTPETCTAGNYPCNDAGYYFNTSGWSYSTSNKVIWGEIYVR